jgi:serine protease DegS
MVPGMRYLIRFILVPALIGGTVGLVIVLGYLAFDSNDGASTRPGFAAAVRKASPAVVNIYSTKMRRPAICEQPRFREWCNRVSGATQTQVQSSLGSGVVVHADGYILTNNHVIQGADEILVMFADGETTTASLVGSDRETDLAVIRVPISDLIPITLGASDEVEVGDLVLAIGNPFGIGQTVSAGIISAKGRAGISRSPYDDFIQTDAAINPGNSGGVLVDTQGRLIGINTMIFSRNGDSTGVGFAIPAQLTYSILEELIETGRVTRGWLGVVLSPTTGSGTESGLFISAIDSDGPAAIAGLAIGDILLAVDGQIADDPNRISRMVGQTEPGQEVVLEVLRQGRRMAVKVAAGVRPEPP